MAPTQPCRYYAMGACTRGNACTFLHANNNNKDAGICEFYLQGNCRFGSYCQLKHTKPKKPVQPQPPKPIQPTVIKPVSVPVSVKKEEKIVLGLCPFQYKGECKYGSTCKYVHGIQCPNCLKYCLDPRDEDQEHANHIMNCTEEKEFTECVVCFEIVQEKKDPRFGLLTCQHCVCLECIRTWRENSTSTAKSCPICRSTTYFVTPSTKWPKTEEEKQEMISKYKEKLSQIDCRHYNKGNGTCPFSTSCFYRHVDEYGVKHSDKIRILSNGDFDDEGLKKGIPFCTTTDRCLNAPLTSYKHIHILRHITRTLKRQPSSGKFTEKNFEEISVGGSANTENLKKIARNTFTQMANAGKGYLVAQGWIPEHKKEHITIKPPIKSLYFLSDDEPIIVTEVSDLIADSLYYALTVNEPLPRKQASFSEVEEFFGKLKTKRKLDEDDISIIKECFAKQKIKYEDLIETGDLAITDEKLKEDGISQRGSRNAILAVIKRASDNAVEEHILKCTSSAEKYKKLECGICYEVIEEKKDSRYALLSCNCPTCRTLTYFVVPSNVWPVTDTERNRLIEGYKKQLSLIDCKYTSGHTCRFGTSCFYKHAPGAENSFQRESIHERMRRMLEAFSRYHFEIDGDDLYDANMHEDGFDAFDLIG
ncbi:hypothetical protein HDV06_003781 [Boothiomyces sp. JEL0866]|nr:hypothetical protein HDV06_003781 [Boothiomyces sp. JEL0866]